jgi:two-component system sensor histidine kinase KdpD
MRGGLARPFLRPDPPPMLAGLLVGTLAVATITAVIFPLRRVSPAESSGVAYLLAVLLVATLWGFRLGVLTSLLSAAALNYFHLPPTGHFALAEEEHWLALAVFLLAAVAASAVADVARSRAIEAEQRRREADVAAELARVLLGGASVGDALPDAARRLAAAFELESATIELEPLERPGEHAYPLMRGDHRIGRLIVGGRVAPDTGARLHARVVPALEASARRWTAIGCRPASSRLGCCGRATSSRRLCSGPSRTTCARR